jgi:cobalamin biosynthesis Co2+ chelatase CbiK
MSILTDEIPESETETAKFKLPDIDNAASLLADEQIQIPPEIIKGVLHQGSKAVLGSSSKACKTWILLDAALSVATGTPWFKWQTQKGRVLFINFEIPRAFIRKRIQVLCEKKGIADASNLDVWNLRGQAAPLGKLESELVSRIKDQGYSLVIIDPIYKALGGRDENSAGDISELCNELERIAVQTGAAVLYAAHFSKGNQAKKETIDRIGGSGVYGRDPDTIITLTKHKEEQDRAFTVDLILRNFPEQESFVVAWNYPLMTQRDDLDPDDLKQVRGRTRTHEPADLLEVMGKDFLTTTEWKARAEEAGISSASFYRILKEIKKSGRVFLGKDRKWESQPVIISFAKENTSPATDSSSRVTGDPSPTMSEKQPATNEKQPAEAPPVGSEKMNASKLGGPDVAAKQVPCSESDRLTPNAFGCAVPSLIK